MHGNCLWISLSTHTFYPLFFFFSTSFLSSPLSPSFLSVKDLTGPSTSSSFNLPVSQRGRGTYGIYIMVIYYSSLNLSRSHPCMLHRLSHTTQHKSFVSLHLGITKWCYDVRREHNSSTAKQGYMVRQTGFYIQILLHVTEGYQLSSQTYSSLRRRHIPYVS